MTPHAVVCGLLVVVSIVTAQNEAECRDDNSGLYNSHVGHEYGTDTCEQARPLCSTYAERVGKAQDNEELTQFCPITCARGCGVGRAPTERPKTILTNEAADVRLTTTTWNKLLDILDLLKLYSQKISNEFLEVATNENVEYARAGLIADVAIFDRKMDQLMYGDLEGEIARPMTEFIFDEINKLNGEWRWFRQLVMSHVQDDPPFETDVLRDAEKWSETIRHEADVTLDAYIAEAYRQGFTDIDFSRNQIRLAREQRVLIEEMAKESLLIVLDVDKQHNQDMLAETVLDFGEQEHALLYGSEKFQTPPTTDPQIRADMDLVETQWAQLKPIFEALATGAADSWTAEQRVHNIHEMEVLVALVLEELNIVVDSYQSLRRRFEAEINNWDWSYQDQRQWGGYCTDRLGQSPINIPTSSANTEMRRANHFLRPWAPRGNETATEMHNTGRGLVIDVIAMNITIVTSLWPEMYALDQLIFHTPSEHLVDGKRFPVELQAHFAPADGREGSPDAIMSLLYEKSSRQDDTDAALAALVAGRINLLKSYPDLRLVVGNLRAALLAELKFTSGWSYDGTGTRPPCKPTRYLVSKPRLVGSEELETVRAVLATEEGGAIPAGSPRPLADPPSERGMARQQQPRNERVVSAVHFFSHT